MLGHTFHTAYIFNNHSCRLQPAATLTLHINKLSRKPYSFNYDATEQIKVKQYCTVSNKCLCVSKEEDKDQDSIQSSTSPDRNTIWESDKNTRKHPTQERQAISTFPAGDHKVARNRQERIKVIWSEMRIKWNNSLIGA